MNNYALNAIDILLNELTDVTSKLVAVLEIQARIVPLSKFFFIGDLVCFTLHIFIWSKESQLLLYLVAMILFIVTSLSFFYMKKSSRLLNKFIELDASLELHISRLPMEYKSRINKRRMKHVQLLKRIHNGN